MNNDQNTSNESSKTLILGALGIVFGDIGTSPLYALRECFNPNLGFVADKINVIGAVSLIFWSLIFIISIKYIIFVLRADNRGEGGILALMTLVTRDKKAGKFLQFFLLTLGIFGAALLYGDGIIVPAISVLSAVEGLNLATSISQHQIIFISIIILIILFLMQRHGTGKVGLIFGPIMLVWFSVIALLGLCSIFYSPSILLALIPTYAINFFIHNGIHGFAILGTIFLALTGGENLYADIGHCGVTPIRKGWYKIVFPCLVLNYFGQGAYLIANPNGVENLFFKLCPSWAMFPVIVLATLATIIASQAVISGTFSLTRQAVQLGFLPRLEIIHTSNEKIGQVYVPLINGWLLLGTILLILGFKQSTNLASAYGIAVSATMVITTILTGFVAYRVWNMKLKYVIWAALFFLVIELSFLFSNLFKFYQGGYIPILIAGLIFIVMLIWKKGRNILRVNLETQAFGVDLFLNDVVNRKPLRVPGIAIFLTGNPYGIPRTLLHNFKHNKILHEQIVLLTVRTEEVPRITDEERISFESLGQGFYRVMVKYGFSENPDIPKILKSIENDELNFNPMKTTYFLGRETLLIGNSKGFEKWRKKIFVFLSHNAFDATQFFKIPPNAVIELGIQVQL